ncbi:MAG TPA: hypothetical protein VGK38_04365, partial [Prolixibacteraceae bacterium]
MKFKSAISMVFLAGILVLLLSNCSKEEEKVLATVTIADVTGISETTATCGGEVISDGGAKVALRGVHWSSTEVLTFLNDSTTNDSFGTGTF